ncbi:MAG: DEAD/DEAH box helicase [Actinomycetales bacterium]
MPSPAERFAAARDRAALARSELATFRAGLDFELDPFQVRAAQALEAGRGVLVAAPTGSGKTVVGEFAVHLAITQGSKAFYTTPIKALSNQKYTDLVRRYGADSVGLLTGDVSVNGEAPVVVMTTEVLRNMLYAGSSTLAGLGYVVMDEVHYLADRFRGAVWEEVIIHLAEDVRVVSLSATVSNAEEFGDWLDTVRGDTEVIVEEHRPVPLWQHVIVRDRLMDLFELPDDGDPRGAVDVSAELVATVREQERRLRESRYATRAARGRGRRQTSSLGGSGRRGGHGGPGRPEVVERLERSGLLPAITFIFSRAGCDAAVQQCLRWGLRLTTPEEARTIREYAEEHTADIGEPDLAVLGYWEWLDGLEHGLAAHHAGLLPVFKEVVEALFTRGLIKAVFATETLALGINMPAKSVVLERLVKWNGETHADITPGEYTQLTGRAGRRGIDVEGHAVVLWQPGVDPVAVAGLASTRTYPLRSSFRPTYNMAVNLVDQVGRERAREILETSFAQFQADRAVVGLARQVRRNTEALEGYRAAMTCDRGDFEQYAALRRAIKDRENSLARGRSASRRAEAAASLETLRIGDVIRVPTGRRAGYAVVVVPDRTVGLDGPRPTLLTADRQVRKIAAVDLPGPVETVARVRVPKDFNARSPQSRRDLASTLRAAVPHDPPPGRRGGPPVDEDAELARLRRELRAHPCHSCPDREDHARWAERWSRLTAETDALTRRVEGRTNSVARTFDRVCELLGELGYLHGDQVTPEGQRLRRLYTELDLLAAECLRAGVWDALDGPGLASVLSALVHEPRREEQGVTPRVPGGAVETALREMVRIWAALEDRERDHRLPLSGEPDAGLAWAMHRWARGQSLETVLRDTDLAAGDFVRRCKQLVDLLGQVAEASSGPVHRAAEDAIERVRRGVVASN